jgi:hypothetical protein
MILRGNLTSARAIAAASLIILFVGLTACERAKSPPAVDTAVQSATQATTPAAQASGERVAPEATSEAMRAFAAAHLRPGLKPGDFLTSKRDYPTGDTADVYRAVLDTLYVSKDGFPGEVVLYADAQTRAWVCGRPPCPILPMGTGSEPKMETVDAYRIATLNRRHITPNFRYHIPLRLMGETEQREMEIDGRAIAVRDSIAGRRSGMREMPFWLGFQTRYPHAWGYAVLSVVGMNPKKTEAILQVSHQCGTYCHSTETMVLWKVRGQWHVIERVPEAGDSTDLGNESLRYRGVGVHTPLNEIRESRRRDSIRQARLPRDIHGRITAYTGEAVVGAKVTLHTGDNPNVPSATAVTNSLGEYRFENPPVGGAGLMVRCPQSSNRADTLASVTATDVAVGKSVEVNIQFDRNVCNDAANVVKAQTIQPAFNAPPMQNAVDSARARNSTYPSDDEAAVYREVLRAMGYPSGSVTLVYATTRSPCKGSCRGEYMRRIRHAPQVMLSTMENFLSVREQRLDFRAGFPGVPGMTLVGDSAIAAVERAAGHAGALDNWDLIPRAWPAAETMLWLSPVGFSPHRQQAIVELTRMNPGENSSMLWVVNRTSTGWRVIGPSPY